MGLPKQSRDSPQTLIYQKHGPFLEFVTSKNSPFHIFKYTSCRSGSKCSD